MVKRKLLIVVFLCKSMRPGLVIFAIILILGVVGWIYMKSSMEQEEKDLAMEKCCRECLRTFHPGWETKPFCPNVSEMSANCINLLEIGNLSGQDTAKAILGKC